MKKAAHVSSKDGKALFPHKLEHYKQLINKELQSIVTDFESSTYEQFGQYSLDSVQAFTSVLNRGGKRIRGALVIVAYEMFGGTNEALAVKAACALELLQTYMLIIDDIADRSPSRRGGPSAHVLIRDWYESKRFGGDAEHFGKSIATNAALLGNHFAFGLIANLDAKDSVKIEAIKILNQNLIITAHGQFNDMFNEILQTKDQEMIENVLIWKTAYYTFVNPLHFGATLAGASSKYLDILSEYSIHAGRAFQIKDDILGTFGKEFDSGKSPLDDIKEGKRTLLIENALAHLPKAETYFLESCLGNQKLTLPDFERARTLITESGALAYTENEAKLSSEKAVEVLKNKASNLDSNSVIFLEQLAKFLVSRKS